MADGLRAVSSVDPVLVNHVIDYRTRVAIHVYRGWGPPANRGLGAPYKKRQRLDIISELWKDVRNGRMMVCSTNSIPHFDKIICTPPT